MGRIHDAMSGAERRRVGRKGGIREAGTWVEERMDVAMGEGW